MGELLLSYYSARSHWISILTSSSLLLNLFEGRRISGERGMRSELGLRLSVKFGVAIGSSFGTRVARLMFRFFVFICFACHHHKFLSPSWQFNCQYCTTRLPKKKIKHRQLPLASIVSMNTHTATHTLVCVYTGLCVCLSVSVSLFVF